MHSERDKLNLKTFDQLLLLVTNQLKHHTTFWVGSFELTDDFFSYIIINLTISFANYSITHSHT